MYPSLVTIREVGPRDGFQMESSFIPTLKKAQIINMLARAGLQMIEATSFVHPAAVPQLKDAEELLGLLSVPRETVLSALIVNEKGLQRALKAGLPQVQMVVSASEEHSLRNVRMSVDEALNQTRAVCHQAQEKGLPVRSAVATAFGCPFAGAIRPERMQKIISSMLQGGITQITLADTPGLANPRQVRQLLTSLQEEFKDVTWGLHFHDTRGLGLANIYASLEAGITLFEGSIGGLGGCPFLPGASGNVATEDLVNMFEEMGVATGIDLEALLHVARKVEETVKRPLPGRLLHLPARKYIC